MSRLRIFTWHIHGSYLFYLSQGNYDIFIPVDRHKSEGYYGRGNTFPFGQNLHEVPVAAVKDLQFDLILFQTDKNYLKDQYEILSEEQRLLPQIYLKHDPPWEHPTNAKLPVRDPLVTIVHVTHFNQLMWDNNGLDSVVIEHGVMVPDVRYQGTLNKGIVIINHLPERGRLLGLDIFMELRKKIPLDLVGMGAEAYGIGEVLHPDLPAFMAKYRFFFNPIRYTSLGLAVCEAMLLGMPIVGLATTEMAVTIQNDYSGYIHTDLNYLVEKMQLLLDHPERAEKIGENAKQVAKERFDIHRFTMQWEQVFEEVKAKRMFVQY